MDAQILNITMFYLAAAFAVGGAFMMIWQRNPVASAMFLILSLLSQAVLYILLDAVFVGALLIIIYAGAIVTLVLFVIMLLNLRGGEYVDQSSGLSRYIKLLVSAAIGGELIYIISKTALPTLQFDSAVGANFGGVKEVALLLYSKYLYGFEITSLLLLIAIVGAVMLAKQSDDESEDEQGSDVETPTTPINSTTAGQS